MKGFFKGVAWVSFFIVLLAGGVYAYLKWWDKTGTLDAIVGQVKGAAVESVTKASTAALQSAGQAAAGTAKQTASDALSSLGNALSEFAASVVGPATSSVPLAGQGIAVASSGPVAVPAATSSSFSLPPPFTTITTKVGASLTFSVNREGSYSIAWGDGQGDDGTVAANATALVSHAWGTEGDYTVQFNVTDSDGAHAFAFPVRVYE